MTDRRFTLSTDPDDAPAVLPDGTVLDGEVADAYAERVLTDARDRGLIPRRGRRSLSGHGSHSPQLQIRVSADLREEIDSAAHAAGVSVSAFARRALEHYLHRVDDIRS